MARKTVPESTLKTTFKNTTKTNSGTLLMTSPETNLWSTNKATRWWCSNERMTCSRQAAGSSSVEPVAVDAHPSMANPEGTGETISEADQESVPVVTPSNQLPLDDRVERAQELLAAWVPVLFNPTIWNLNETRLSFIENFLVLKIIQ